MRRFYIDPQEAAQLELDAAAQRSVRARAAFDDFAAKHTLLIDGRVPALLQERDEIDFKFHTAAMQFQKALAHYTLGPPTGPHSPDSRH